MIRDNDSYGLRYVTGDSSAVTTQEFASFDERRAAGKFAGQMLVTTVKNVKFVCVEK